MKCPRCGAWNQAFLPKCVKCGTPLEENSLKTKSWEALGDTEGILMTLTELCWVLAGMGSGDGGRVRDGASWLSHRSLSASQL